MPSYQFETHEPVDLFVEFGKGNLAIECAETTESTVTVEGRHADEVVVEQTGQGLRVVEPRSGRIFGDQRLVVEIVVPTGSRPRVRTGSADVQLEGRAGEGWFQTGSGEVTLDHAQGHLVVETGSGDVHVEEVDGDLKVKSGSGDVHVGTATGPVAVSTGSGDVDLDASASALVVKTGSGDLHVGTAGHETSFTTGSGDLRIDEVHRGQVSAKTASGDVAVGVRTGVPVWTDVTTVSGQIRSLLQGVGQPQDGQDHVEVRARTVSGDVALTEV